MLGPLRKIMSGNPSEAVEVNEEFVNEVNRVKRALDEMVRIHPFDPNLPTVVVVDTSLKQTGGFIYQMDGKIPRFTGFYSNNRPDKDRKIFIGSCHMEVLGFGGLLQAYFSMFQSAKLPITLITDSASFVKLYAKFKRNEIPSVDTAINNVFYYMGIILNFNVIHMKNTEAKMMFSDGLSRITEILGLPVPQNDCVGAPRCKVCQAATLIDNGTRIGVVMEKLCNSTIGVLREGGNMDNTLCLPNDLQIFGLRKEPTFKKIHFSTIKKVKYRLETLLKDTVVLQVLQMKSPDLRKLRRAIENGVVNFPKQEARLQRMMDDENAVLINGVIHITKVVEGVERRVLPLPPQSAPIAIAATHETVGHRSFTQLLLQVKVNFSFPRMREMVAAFVDSCVRCSLVKGSSNFVKTKMKPVPVPEDIYTTILMDEMVRTYKSESVKFMVAMEGASQFAICVVYEGAMSGPKFLAMVALCKTLLCPHSMKNTKIEVRVDGAAWHTSAVVRECLAQLNVELQIHQSTTFSKNILPELDNKMRRIGENLAHFMESTSVPLQLAVQLAVAKCNSTIGVNGRTPAEIFTGRCWKSNEMIQIDVKELLKDIVKRRESQRLMKERERAAKHMKKELELVPYEDASLNSPLIFNKQLIKIRVGDLVTLKSQQSDDKNDLPSAWTVLDISFPKRLLHLKKRSGAETGHGDAKWVAFELVDKVFPKEDRILHIQEASELDDVDIEEADRVWVEGRQNVSDLVMSALVATQDMWCGPGPIEEELVPNLQFSRELQGTNEERRSDFSCRMSSLPRKVKVAPEEVAPEEEVAPKKEEPIVPDVKKEEAKEVKKEEVKKEKDEEVKEEFKTPEACSPVFGTPMESLDKGWDDLRDVDFDKLPKLHLDQSFEEEPVPEAPKPESKAGKKKARTSTREKKSRTSNREKKPIDRFIPG